MFITIICNVFAGLCRVLYSVTCSTVSALFMMLFVMPLLCSVKSLALCSPSCVSYPVMCFAFFATNMYDALSREIALLCRLLMFSALLVVVSDIMWLTFASMCLMICATLLVLSALFTMYPVVSVVISFMSVISTLRGFGKS